MRQQRLGTEHFDRAQRGLVQLAGEPWVRRFLSIDDWVGGQGLPVVALWPSSVHFALPDGQRLAVFCPRPWVAERVQHLAIWQQQHGRVGARLIASDPRLAMLELAAARDFNPDASPESTSCDGYAGRTSVDEAFGTLRGGAGNESGDSAVSYDAPYLAASGTSDQWSRLRRAFYLFDTSGLTAAATIISATLSLYGSNKVAGLGSALATALVGSTPASNTAIANGDYGNVGSTEFASRITYAGWDTAGYNAFALNASGLAAISKTGISKFATRAGWDVDNSPPAWGGGQPGELVTALQADNGSNKPKLSVTYSAPNALLFAAFP